MSTVNLSDAKVSYEGQELPAINLINKLQSQIHEMACRLEAISETLGNLQAALLDSQTVEVKLTLSREDFSKFRALRGTDDNERIRQAVLALIDPEASDVSKKPFDTKSPMAQKSVTPVVSQSERFDQDKLPTAEPSAKKRTTNCPVCHYLIELPESAKDQLSVEVKCENCGAKSLLKSRM